MQPLDARFTRRRAGVDQECLSVCLNIFILDVDRHRQGKAQVLILDMKTVTSILAALHPRRMNQNGGTFTILGKLIIKP